MTDQLIQLPFDYGLMPTEAREKVVRLNSENRTMEGRIKNDGLRMGENFAVIRDEIRHNKAGGFDGWITLEGWKRGTVYNLISIYETFGNCPNFEQLDIAPSALYLLAAPSTPVEARAEALERAEAGETITHAKAQQITSEYKPAPDLLREVGINLDAPAPVLFDDIEYEEERDEEGFTDQQYHAAHYLEGIAADNGLTIEATPVELSGDEWYTPAEYIAAAREVLGTIDLDPASCDEAQEIVKADTYYTEERDGLLLPWYGRVWCNPPYSMPLIQKFVKRAIDFYEAGELESAIILTNNCTDAGWFHSLMEGYPVCFTRGRVPFWRPGQVKFATRQGQAFFYLGNDIERFMRVFSQFGIFPNVMGDSDE